MQLPLFIIFAYGSKHKTFWMMLTLLIMTLLFLSLGTVSGSGVHSLKSILSFAFSIPYHPIVQVGQTLALQTV